MAWNNLKAGNAVHTCVTVCPPPAPNPWSGAPAAAPRVWFPHVAPSERMVGAIKSFLTRNRGWIPRAVLESKTISTSCAWLVRRGRHRPRLGSLKAWSSRHGQSAIYIYIPPNCLSQGVLANLSVPVNLKAFFPEEQSGGINTPGSSCQARILGNWGINIPAPSPLWWDNYETCIFYRFSDFFLWH